jgi:hypothetical protein
MSYPPTTPPQQPYVPQPPRKTNPLAIAGFATSFLSCCLWFVPIGLVLSIIALVQISKDPNQGGKGLAIAGIAISALCILLGIVGVGAGAILSEAGY